MKTQKKYDPSSNDVGPMILVQVTPIKQLVRNSTSSEPSQLGGYQATAGIGETSIFEEMPDRIFDAVTEMTEKFAAAVTKISKDCKPDEFSVKFGLSFAQKGGIIVASGEAKQEFEVNLKWKFTGK